MNYELISPPERAALFIGGEPVWPASSGTYQHRFAATGVVQGEVALAGAMDVDAAVTSAERGFAVWSKMSPDVRRDHLLRLADMVETHGDELVALSVYDSAFPLNVASLGPSRGAGGIRYFAGWADKIRGETIPVWPTRALDYTLLEPFGVVGMFATWNTPVYNLGLTIAPALAAGNAVVLKPSELAPYAYLRFAELAIEAGLPPGVLNVIPGGVEAGQAMVQHPGIKKIHFTGGPVAAHNVLEAAAKSLTPVDLELGGKSANIVFPDADLDAAAAASIGAIVGGSGQTCITASRMLVHESIYEEVVDIAVQKAKAAVMGDPFEATTTMGPLITAVAQSRVLGMAKRARTAGARLCVGGGTGEMGAEGGYFVEPTVFADVDPDSELFKNEAYGPLLAVTPFANEAEAVALANGTQYGLAAYVQTSDLSTAHRIARQIQAGTVYVNGRGGLPPGAPFGGFKDSGFGRLGGEQGLQAFLQTKNVWIAIPDE